MHNSSTFIASTNASGATTALRHHSGSRPDARIDPPVLRRHAHLVRYKDVEADFDTLIEKAITAISDCEPVDDEILGRYINVASLVRAVSFREGKLLELAFERLSKVNPDLTVLVQSLKLPLVKAAVEAVSGNDWRHLDGIRLDCEAPAKGSYTPDLILVNRARHAAFILDLKRSLASYGDTTRLEELKLKMLASAMVLPDWLYKNHKRLMVDSVGVAIIDGASRPSDHAAGVWALSEIDDLLEIDGAAGCMAELRLRFGRRVQTLLETEARRALGIVHPHVTARTTTLPRFGALRSNRRSMPDITPVGMGADEMTAPEDCGFAAADDREDDLDADLANAEDDDILPVSRIRIGFARRLLEA